MNIAFTVGPLDADLGAGLTVATAGLARALARSGAAHVAVFGRRPPNTLNEQLWAGTTVYARGSSGHRIREFDVGLASAIRAVAPAVVHSHGLWLSHQWSAWRAAQREGIPRLVAPHGQLDPWARRRSALKKRLAWTLYQRQSLRSATCLHALHEGEVAEIRAAGLRNPVCVVSNGIDAPEMVDASPPWREAFPSDARVLLFLGRLGEQKGVVELVRAWLEICRDPGVVQARWRLALVGWPEAPVLARIRAEIAREGLENSVGIFGPQHGVEKAACFANATAFVLPSRSEGLPMAVLEAWSHSLPVAMTKACNLPIGFSERAAVEISLNADALAAGLKNFLRMPSAAHGKLGEQGRKLVQTVFSWDLAARNMLDVYEWCIGRRDAPESIRFA